MNRTARKHFPSLRMFWGEKVVAKISYLQINVTYGYKIIIFLWLLTNYLIVI